MNIVYDIFNNNPELADVATSIPEIDESFIELHSFIEGQLKPLQDDIDKEESKGQIEDRGVVLLFERKPEYKDMFIVFWNYSDELTIKMKSLFTQKDLDYIMNKILYILNRWQQ